MLHIPLRLSPLAVALWLASSPSQAVELEPQVITANPLGNRQLAAPSTVLEGDDLLQQQHGSLGETLNKQPGVASTWFGPGASRPVIRGLDGDRIRILRNGVGALDASSLSYDHAVPLDPVTVDRVEIVRGPAALLYGGNAIGGVVNTFDNRIPDSPIEGIHGAGELRYGGADTTRSSAGKLEAGDGTFALHLDANSRQFNDLRIPGYAQSTKVRDADAPGSRPLEGVVGAQVSRNEFSALGEEAFVPHTDTDSLAVFMLEQWQATERLNLSLGARMEHTRVEPDAKGNENFVDADSASSFNALSLSSGAVYQLDPIWSLAANLSYTERAPTFYELYANGAHVTKESYVFC